MYVRMKVENEMLQDAKMEAWIHYTFSKVDYSNQLEFTAIIRGIEDNAHFDDLLFRCNESKIEQIFDSVEEALHWLEEKCKELVIEELSIRVWRGKRAQEKIDEINENGFYL